MMKKILLLCLVCARISYALDCAPEQLNTKLEYMHDQDQEPKFESMLAQSDQRYFPSPENEKKLKAIIQKVIAADKLNRQSLDEIVSECGWPEPKKLSYKANYAVFLIVQHADEAAYRQKYLPYFQKLYEANEFPAEWYAMLVDRIRLMDQGKPQLYGTHSDPTKNDISVYMQVEDPENLNNRREQMGLSRIKMFDDLYLPKKDKAALNVKANKKKNP